MVGPVVLVEAYANRDATQRLPDLIFRQHRRRIYVEQAGLHKFKVDLVNIRESGRLPVA